MPSAIEPPGGQPWAKLVETHSAVVIFLGDRVVKIKKPVDLGFLDFRSREVRRRIVEAEVQLNRRLAPDVYLGVLDIVLEPGRPVDHAVLMRRLPDAARLSALIRSGVPVGDHIERIARVLTDFHARAVRPPDAMDIAGPDALRHLWLATLGPLEQVTADRTMVDRIHREAIHFITRHSRLLSDRVHEGHIRDGHGDLLADDIFCFPDRVEILDCLEFERRFRIGDTVSDAAFLVMDLERLGAARAARKFAEDYRRLSGDDFPRVLLQHYISYRALVRAKVALVRFEQGDPTAYGTARGLISLAHDHARAARIKVILVGGLPGTGKSTIAEAVSSDLGAALLSSDRVRKEMNGIPEGVSAAAPYGEGLYTSDMTARVYSELRARARSAITGGRDVVLDASWSDPHQRAAVQDLAERRDVDIVPLECVAPADVVRTRLAARAQPASSSDAGVSIYTRMAGGWAPWPEAIRIDTSGSVEESVAAALAGLEQPQPVCSSAVSVPASEVRSSP
ncbi:MAG TPA: AAA family ATPase [Mycobacteriales bacterium]|nr:AAA family ATPase [Mycobacteriales bacterium]